MPVYYGPQVKECYENVKILLNKVNYEEYRWGICGDFKIISMILGLQLRYKRHMCFLCRWNSRSKEKHYVRKVWPPRQQTTTGQKNVQAIPLVDRDKIVLPPLHIKLGIVKNFIKAMNKTGAGVSFLREKFPRLGGAKLKEGVLVGPDIRELMLDSGFDAVLNEVELKIWKSVKNVINSYLGNRKSENYETLVRDMLQNFQQMKGNQSLEIHMLDSHLVFFPDNLGAVSDEHGERFHQEIATLENRYNSKRIREYVGRLLLECGD
ncbi:hypothetical protein QAD02_021446 [Eretmocerus hayati]|uniref:Uncharacterized protein n=1 Tax=Eretmocerus hayati TaxID=131215 RepID=A0ACC2PRB2_9HYME|nr:hypothetical protein QAD02_021446 [Eretmocerus hayati]